MKYWVILGVLLCPSVCFSQSECLLVPSTSNLQVIQTTRDAVGVTHQSECWDSVNLKTYYPLAILSGAVLTNPSGAQVVTQVNAGGISFQNVPCSSLGAQVQTDAGCASAYNSYIVQSKNVSAVNPLRHGLISWFETDLHQVGAGNEFYNAMFSTSTLLDAGSTGAASQRTMAIEIQNIVSDLTNSGTILSNADTLKLRTTIGVNAHVVNAVGLLQYLPTIAGIVTNFSGYAFDAPTGLGSVNGFIVGDWELNTTNVTTQFGIGSVNGSAGAVQKNYGSYNYGLSAAVMADDTTPVGSFIGHAVMPSLPTNLSAATLHDGWYSGTGSPNGVLSAAIGSFYSQRDGALGTGPLWFKTTGTGNTGWNPAPVLAGNGTATLGTTAITAGTCATVVTVASASVATTDVITWSFSAAPGTGYTAGLNVLPYVSSGNVNFLVCNPTAGSLTPAAATLNWTVEK